MCDGRGLEKRAKTAACQVARRAGADGGQIPKKDYGKNFSYKTESGGRGKKGAGKGGFAGEGPVGGLKHGNQHKGRAE